MSQFAVSLSPIAGSDLHDDDSLYEVVNGQRLEPSPKGAFEGVIASLVLLSLGNFAFENGLGLAVAEVLFLLDARRGLQRRPDLAFVSYARWPSDEIPSDNA